MHITERGIKADTPAKDWHHNISLRHTSISRPPRTHEASVVAYLKEKSQYYGQTSRPIDNTSEPMVVNVSLRLIQVDVNEPQNTLTTSVWVRYVSYT